MTIPQAILDEIRARLPVSEVVGRRVRLKRQGREFAGLSPFANERSPSFFVNDQKGFYHCFSSGKHGDIFRFLMETEGLSFPEAVQELAREAGVDLPGDQHGETPQQRIDRERRVAAIEKERAEREAARAIDDEADRARRLGTAKGIWQLTEPLAGTLGEAYFAGRGIDPAIIRAEPSLRFAPLLEWQLGSTWEKRGGRDVKVAPGPSFPAVVGRVSDSAGRGIAVWQIWLGNGAKGRAPVKPAKAGKGVAMGGAVWLGEPAEEIGIAEAIEEAAAVREINGSAFPVAGCMASNFLEKFVVPPGVKRVMVFPNYDLPKQDKVSGEWRTPAGEKASAGFAARQADRGITVEIAPRPPGLPCDWVDILRKLKGLPPE